MTEDGLAELFLEATRGEHCKLRPTNMSARLAAGLSDAQTQPNEIIKCSPIGCHLIKTDMLANGPEVL